MSNTDNEICRLCLSVVCGKDVHSIEDIENEALDTIWLNIDLGICNPAYICRTCFKEVRKIHQFKLTLLNVERYLVSFANKRSISKVHLREVLRETNGALTFREKFTQICRLCLKPIETDITCKMCILDENTVLNTMLRTCLSELNLTLTVDRTVCLPCLDSLDGYFKFVVRTTSTEAEIKNFLEHTNIKLVNLQEVLNQRPATDRAEQNILVEKEEDYQDQDHKFKTTDKDLDYGESDEMLIKSEECQVKGDSEVNSGSNSGEDVKEDTEKDNSKNDKNNNSCRLPGSKKQKKKRHRYNVIQPTPLRCSHCKYTTSRIINIKRHLATHKFPIMQCQKCEYKTRYKGRFAIHLESHKPVSEVEYKCNVCPYKSKKKGCFTAHCKIHEEPKYICKICGYRPKKISRLKEHLRMHVRKEEKRAQIYQCFHCSYKSTKKGLLVVHLITHREPEFKCLHCDFRAKTKGYLKTHILTHKTSDEAPLLKCEHCDFVTKYKYSLPNHYKRVHIKQEAEKRFPCDQCDYKAKQLYTLRKHKLRHKTETPFLCDRCPFATKTTNRLNVHKKLRHGREKPFLDCPKCDYRTQSEGMYGRHMQGHENQEDETGFFCHECGHRSRTKLLLAVHVLVHRTPQFRCTDCDFAGRTKQAVQQHFRNRHEGVVKPKNLRCRICDFAYEDESKLRRHLLVHGEPQFECAICGVKMKRKDYLKKHMLAHEVKLERLKKKKKSKNTAQKSL